MVRRTLPLHRRRTRRRRLPGLRRAVAPAADTDAPPSSVGLARIAAAGGQRTRDNAAYSAAFYLMSQPRPDDGAVLFGSFLCIEGCLYLPTWQLG